ncbi:MAG: hypothetical protein Fur0046_21970 [Cyanobacteria bacterium J069]|nr:MAG: DUF4242 domain-containing protein [Cyanobacteria bacterium J069]
MTFIIVETDRPTPITPEVLAAEEARSVSCLAEHYAQWRYSLLSSDRHRMICTFDAPDVEAVRMAYRKANVSFEKMWAEQVLEPPGTPPIWQESALAVAESFYPGGLTNEQWNTQWQVVTEQLLPFYAQQGVEWVRSHVAPNRTLVLYELNTPDLNLIRHAHQQFNLPLSRIWSAMLFKP